MTTADQTGDTLVVRRVLAIAREKVFAAWLDPASLAQWMRPGAVSHATVEVDPRVGGKFRIVMHRSQGAGGDVEHWGEYLAIEPPARLSFTWISVHTDLRPSVVTVELAEHGTGTELTAGDLRVAPNPMMASAAIGFRLGEPARVTVDVIDVAARRVRTFLAGRNLAPGKHSVAWDGRDASGARVRPGVYFVRLTTATDALVRRLVVLE